MDGLYFEETGVMERMLFILLIFLIPTVLFSQSRKNSKAGSPNAEVQKIIDQISDYYLSDGAFESVPAETGRVHTGQPEANMEEIEEYFERLLRRPLNINSASRSDLQRLILLNDFQITALLSYIKEHGAIISFSELSLLNGFDKEIVSLLRPFIYFGDAFLRPGNFFKDCNSSLYSKYSRKFLSSSGKTDSKKSFGDKNYIQLRFRTTWLNRAEAAFLMEKDAGEPMVEKNKIPCGDFISFCVALHNIGFAKRKAEGTIKKFSIDNIIAGDFSARFGQGLTIWNSFNLQGAEDVCGFYKRGEPVSAYMSSDENKFFRGAAAEFSYGRVTISLIGSYNSTDARIKSGEEGFTSILQGGVHDSRSLMQTKDALKEYITGTNITALFNKIKIGFSFAGYGYNREDARSVKDYNRYQIYDGFHWNCSSDFYAVTGKIRLFGEFAYSSAGREKEFGYAALAGGTASLHNGWKINFIIRSYSRSYIAPHAGAYSAISSCSNQNGAAVRLSGNIFKKLKIYAGADYVYYPWARFNVNSSSSVFKSYAKFEYISGCVNLSARILYRYLKTTKIKYLFSEKTVLKIYLNNWLETGAAQEWNSARNYSLSLQSNVKLSRWKFNFCAAYYDVEGWDDRLYMVEYDLPMTYTSSLLYGRGINMYLMTGASLLKWADVYCKVQRQIKIPKDEKKSPLVLKAGIRFSF